MFDNTTFALTVFAVLSMITGFTMLILAICEWETDNVESAKKLVKSGFAMLLGGIALCVIIDLISVIK